MSDQAPVRKLTMQKVALDLGCGANKANGYIGVDKFKKKGVDVVCDLGKDKWPWDDNSVDAAFSSHFLEHLTWPERIHFFNELGRVLKPGAKFELCIPHWNSPGWFSSPGHREPMSAGAFKALSKKQRIEWEGVTGEEEEQYTCDLETVQVNLQLEPWVYGEHFAVAGYSNLVAILRKVGGT